MTEFKRKTFTEVMGYSVGQQFTVMETCAFKKGTIVTLYKDDGTCAPSFRDSEGNIYYVDLTRLQPYADLRTPAQKAGLIIGARYKVAESSNSTGAGEVVEFFEDDGSNCPIFRFGSNKVACCPYVHEVTLYEPKTVVEFEKDLTPDQIEALKKLVETF